VTFAARVFRVVLPLVVLGAGAVGAGVLISRRSAPVKEPPDTRGVLVEVEPVRASRERLRVQAFGTVVPARRVVLEPEVSGKVVWRAPELVPGGRFRRGAALVRIDASDYALALRQRRAGVEQAEQELLVEKSRKAIARREWDIIGEEQNATQEGKAVALREPQLKSAEAALNAAESAASQAALAASRTAIVAPFNGFVIGTAVDVGQLVAPGMQLAELIGSDEFWIQVSIPMDALAALAVPGVNAESEAGAEVTIRQELGEKKLVRHGRVVRLLGDLDPVGRMARLLVSLADPLTIPRQEASREGEQNGATALPLLLGAYVEVEIQGREVVDVVELPRRALREGNQALIYGKGDRLEVREVDVVWRREHSVLLTGGVRDGEEVIVSRISNAVDGLKLRKAPREKPAQPAAARRAP
jgi:multidrug efflux pump subunit AcrA (membrane-fusion protein)